MAAFNIKRPADQTMNLGRAGKAKLTWSPKFADGRSENFNRKQAFVDSEVLRLDAPLIPIKTGNLINSGIRGTKIGTGEVVYNAPYSSHQYYETAETRPYDPRRGARWFERMKAAHLNDIKRGAEQI